VPDLVDGAGEFFRRFGYSGPRRTEPAHHGGHIHGVRVLPRHDRCDMLIGRRIIEVGGDRGRAHEAALSAGSALEKVHGQSDGYEVRHGRQARTRGLDSGQGQMNPHNARTGLRGDPGFLAQHPHELLAHEGGQFPLVLL
jgi:hypothetical protein